MHYNDLYEGFKFVELSSDKFKYLVFIQGLVANKLENETNLIIQNIAKDCQRFINVRQDAKDIEVNGVSLIKMFLRKIK